MEKRNIQISLKEAREWYNSGDSFKKELALKAYKEEELVPIIDYNYIYDRTPSVVIDKIYRKTIIYMRFLIVSRYINDIYPVQYTEKTKEPKHYRIYTHEISSVYINYKSFTISECLIKRTYNIAFNSFEAAKQAIDILGDELNVLFE